MASNTHMSTKQACGQQVGQNSPPDQIPLGEDVSQMGLAVKLSVHVAHFADGHQPHICQHVLGDGRKVWQSNFVDKELFLLKNWKTCQIFQNHVCHLFQFRQITPILLCMCWWWLVSGLVSHSFRKHLVSKFATHSLYMIVYSASITFQLRMRLEVYTVICGIFGSSSFAGKIIPR